MPLVVSKIYAQRALHFGGNDSILATWSSSLAMCQETIIPQQSQKHGSDGYPSKRYLRWDCACFAGVANGACSVGLVSQVFVGLTGCAEPGSREFGKVANKWFRCQDPLIKTREMLWHPTKSEFEDWLESKTLIFMQKVLILHSDLGTKQ